MSGIKGLSGRKCLRDEEKRLRVIEKSWDIIEEFLDSDSIPIRDKAEVAIKIAVKNIPTEITGSLAVDLTEELTEANNRLGAYARISATN